VTRGEVVAVFMGTPRSAPSSPRDLTEEQTACHSFENSLHRVGV
jgi:hypothetical protein